MGSRVFSITINSQTVEPGFDIVQQAGGPNTAVDRTYPVTVTTGLIQIQLGAIVNNAKINALEIFQLTEKTCERTDLYYDTNPFAPSFTQYGVGRPTAAQWGGSGCTVPYQFQQMYSYTQAGRMTKKQLSASGAASFLALSQQSYDKGH